MKSCNINELKEKLEAGQTVTITTNGVSMKPLLKTHKDMIVISKPNFPLKIDDVVLYRRPDVKELILHRVIGIGNDGIYIIRGDNTYYKEYIPQDDIVGVMVELYRRGKYMNCQSSKPYKIYVKLNKFFYPLRWIWNTKIRVLLSKIKQKTKTLVG